MSPVLKFNYHKKAKNQSERMLNQWKIFINQTLSFLFYFILFLKALNFFTPPFSSFSRFHWTPHLHIFWGCIIFSLEILCWTLECNCLKLIHLPKVCIYSCDQSHGFWIFVQQPKLVIRKRQKGSNCMKRFISHLVQTISCTMLHNCHTKSDKWLIC